jgi:hypothetical protein
VHGRGVERLPALGRLPHGDDALARRDQVDLLVEDPILVADADRDEEDAEDVPLVSFQPRSRLVGVDRPLQEQLERALVDRLRERGVERLRRWVEEVDPLAMPAERRVASG